MSLVHGRVRSVAWVTYGTELAADAALGATVLSIDDAADFDEDGGTLVVNDQVVAYASVVDNDDDTMPDSVTLAEGLDAAAVEGDRLELYDVDAGKVFSELRAEVDPDDGDLEPGEPLDAVVADDQVNHLPEGIRADGAGESVLLEEDEDDDEWYVVRVLGQADHPQDASRLDPIGLPIPVPTVAPTTSPTLTVYSTPTGFIVRATDVDPGTLIDYHISATDGFTPNGTLSVTTAATVVTVNTLADATPLAPDTDYFLVAVAHNVVGTAPASAQVSARLNLIDSDAVEQIAADLIVGGNLIGAFALLGFLQIGGMTFDPADGITIPQPGGGVIQFPADGSEALIQAAAILNSATVLGKFKMQGTDNELATGSVTTLASGVTSPLVAPTVGQTWPSVTLVPPAYATTPRSLNVLSGGGYAVIYTGTGATAPDNGISAVYEFDAAGVQTAVHALPSGFRATSFTPSGTNWLVIGSDSNRGDGDTYIYKYNSSWAKTGESLYGTSNNPYDRSIGTDAAGNVVLGGCSVLTGELVFSGYTAASIGGTLVEASGYSKFTEINVSAHCYNVLGLSADFGASRLVAQIAARRYVFNTTPVRQTAQEWPNAVSSSSRGLAWDGTRFFSLDSAGKVYQYSRNLATAQSIAYTWYDNDAAGTGTHESMISPAKAYTMSKRAWLVVTTPQPQDNGDDDAPNAVRIYVSATSGGTRYRQADLGTGVITATYDQPAVSGSTAPTSNGFDTAGATVAQLKSGAADGDGALADVKGSGVVRFASMTPEAFARRTSTAGQGIATGISDPVTVEFGTAVGTQKSVTYSAGTFTIVKAGLYAISSGVRFTANATGRRYSQMLVNSTVVKLVEVGNVSGSIPTIAVDIAAIALAVGDTVKVQAAHNVGADLDLSTAAGAVTFAMVRLSAAA